MALLTDLNEREWIQKRFQGKKLQIWRMIPNGKEWYKQGEKVMSLGLLSFVRGGTICHYDD